MPTSTIQIGSTMDWAAKLNFGRNSAVGSSSEPALTSANTILQTMLGAPFAWRWNRIVTGFMGQPGQQDYTLFNWVASTDVRKSWQTVDAAGNAHAVTSAGKTGNAAPSFNATKGGTTTDGTVTWTNLGSLLIPVSQTYRFGWIETVSVADTTPAVPKWTEIESQLCLGLDSAPGRPAYIAGQGDDGSGNITFRLMPVPDKAYPTAVTIQQKPTLITGTTATWAPIPDEFSRIYNWGFLSLMWLFADDPRFSVANQKFVSQLLGASEGLTETERNIFIQNWQAITGQAMSNMTAKSQGFQSRGV